MQIKDEDREAMNLVTQSLSVLEMEEKVCPKSDCEYKDDNISIFCPYCFLCDVLSHIAKRAFFGD